MNLELVGFRQHGNGGGTGVHTALRFGDGHTLHAMHAAFILQCAVDIGSADGEVDLLVSANGTLADAGDAELPAFRIAEALVHLEQVAGKEACLVASGTCTNLHLHVLRVFGVLRYECNLDFLFEFRL